MRTGLLRAIVLASALTPLGGGVALASGDLLITNGSPAAPFPQNKQNEPAVAVDPANTNLVAAGVNEEIDNLPCAGSDCSFTPGIGDSGVYLSSDGGQTWTQPTYSGVSGRSGTVQPNGPIGTLPNYARAGLVSDGDPTLAFGPRPDSHGNFSWSNGSRLYYGSLTSNLTAKRTETFAGGEAVAVSHTDNFADATAGINSAWSDPVVVSKQNSALFSDKPDVWSDDAASSRFFGNVYECNIAFRSNGGSAEPLVFSRSLDGGASFSAAQQLTAAAGNARQQGRQGCAIRTDSSGTVFVFWEGAVGGQSVQMMDRSFDGGRSFEKPRPVEAVSDVGVFDAVQADVAFDGVTGARTDSFPSVDIANGAPTGADATNAIAMTWADARAGLNHEQALVSLSGDRGASWTAPVNAAASVDRPDFPAIALAPDGSELYIVYDGFLQPFQTDNQTPRLFQGVVRAASLAGVVPGAFATLHRGAMGDARASSANVLDSEFLGDYNYVAATRSSAVAVWNDARAAADCPAVDAYHSSELTATPLLKPAPPTACPATFGNTDIFGGIF
jgi:hypothetical protein